MSIDNKGMNQDLPESIPTQRSFLEQSIVGGASATGQTTALNAQMSVTSGISQANKTVTNLSDMDVKSVISATTGLKKKVGTNRHSSKKKSNPVNATEVFSWGCDNHGQLGLGLLGLNQNNLQPAPKYCTYGITIREVSCGLDHSAFITNDNHLYAIGSNMYGQLGIGDQTVTKKNSPFLVEYFVNNFDILGVMSVSCGAHHTVVSTLSGHCFTWGEAKYGALGLGGHTANVYTPQRVQVGTIENPSVVQVSAGNYHTVVLDAFGRVFAFGNNEHGQLGVPGRTMEQVPTMIPSFNDMAQMIAAGNQHTLILTRSGLVYACGSNEEGQLGIPHRRKAESPMCIQDISHIPMCYVAAGGFSAAISTEHKELYLWGYGTFGQFQTPHRVKNIEGRLKLVAVGNDFGAALTEQSQLYTWGENPQG